MSDRGSLDGLEIDRQNKEFWDELCGTQLAVSLGFSDDSTESLKKFDQWYFDFYPYLRRHIPFDDLAGKRVLEVGLGYGTVSQEIASKGAKYHGLDIAAGPVNMVDTRLRRLGIEGVVRQGTILDPPFEASSFDYVVAIGCLHHTGDLESAINQVRRLLVPRGEAIIMVYSAASYRQWRADSWATLRRLLHNHPDRGSVGNADAHVRMAYDMNAKGDAAPSTAFTTKAELRHLCREFQKCTIASENIGADGLLRSFPRNLLCRTLGPFVGLDLYCHLVK